MSLLSQVANGLSVLILFLFLIGVVVVLVYIAGSLLLYLFVMVPSIPVEKEMGSVRFRGSKSAILNWFSVQHGKDIFGLLVLGLSIAVVIGLLALLGQVAESLGVSVV